MNLQGKVIVVWWRRHWKATVLRLVEEGAPWLLQICKRCPDGVGVFRRRP